MKSRRLKRVQRTPLRRGAIPAPTTLAVASLAAMLASGIPDTATARNHHRSGSSSSFETQPGHAGPPLMAVVSLARQRITIYDSDGWILRSPVSSGQPGYETPAGIYSVLQKEAEHYSNLYDDASMPFMQRLTWSGIALHAGVLPGHPASHGCVRMPHDFAEHLFELTKVGMRVIVAPKDVAPAAVTDPALFKPRPVLAEAAPRVFTTRPPDAGGEVLATVSGQGSDQSAEQGPTLRAIASAKATEAQASVRKAQAARAALNKLTWDASRAQTALRMTEAAMSRADAQLAAAENAVAAARSPQAAATAQEARVVAFARFLDMQLRVDAATAELQSLPDPARARAEAEAAEAQRIAAVEAAKQAAHRALPISVFVSRKTQHLYVRQSFEPLFDSPVTIRDADQAIGTHVFTALAYTDGNTDLKWNVVSMPEGSRESTPSPSPRHHRIDRLSQTDTDVVEDTHAATAAIERITVPQPALERISTLISPGSAVIISDEGVSSETGHATDFVVIMSGEPQGGIKIRKHNPEVASRSERRAARTERSSDTYSRSSGRPSFGGNYYGGGYYGGTYYGRTNYNYGNSSFFGGYSRF